MNDQVFSYIKIQAENGELTRNRRTRKKLIAVCEKRMREFYPYLNCLDSWFQNELDHVIIEERCISQIVQDVVPLLLENIA